MTKYNETRPYQEMSESQKEVFDQIEERAFRKHWAKEEVDAWQDKRAAMTPEELQAMEEKAERDSKHGTWWLIGFGIIVLAIAGIFFYGEMTGQSLVEGFTGVYKINN